MIPLLNTKKYLFALLIICNSCTSKSENNEKLFGEFKIGEKLNIFAIDENEQFEILKYGEHPQDIFSLAEGRLVINHKLSVDKLVLINPIIDRDSVLIELITLIKSNALNKFKNMTAENPIRDIDFYLKALTEKYGESILIHKNIPEEFNKCKIKFFKQDRIDIVVKQMIFYPYVDWDAKCRFEENLSELIYQWETKKMDIGFSVLKFSSNDSINCRPYFKGQIIYQIKDDYKEEIYQRNKKEEIEKLKGKF